MIFAFGNTVQAGIQVSISSDFLTCRTVNWAYEMRSHFITEMEIKNKCVTQRLGKGMWVALLGRARIFVHSLDCIIVFYIICNKISIHSRTQELTMLPTLWKRGTNCVLYQYVYTFVYSWLIKALRLWERLITHFWYYSICTYSDFFHKRTPARVHNLVVTALVRYLPYRGTLRHTY